MEPSSGRLVAILGPRTKVLELNSDSTLKEIKSRYKILAKKWHPDAQNSVASPNNKDKFIDISNAYKTILKTFTKLDTKK